MRDSCVRICCPQGTSGTVPHVPKDSWITASPLCLTDSTLNSSCLQVGGSSAQLKSKAGSLQPASRARMVCKMSFPSSLRKVGGSFLLTRSWQPLLGE